MMIFVSVPPCSTTYTLYSAQSALSRIEEVDITGGWKEGDA